MCFGVLWVGLDRGLQMFFSLITLPFSFEHDGNIAMGHGMLRVVFQKFFVNGDGLVCLSLLVENEREVVSRFKIGGTDSRCFGVALRRFVDLVVHLESEAEIVMSDGALGFQRDGMLEEDDAVLP